MDSKLESENGIHRMMSYIRSRDSIFIKEKLLDDLKHYERFNSTKVSILIKKETDFAPFFNQGYFFSNETGGLIKVEAKTKGSNLSVILPFSYYRYTPPFSGYFSLFIKNSPTHKELNCVLNNALGDTLNNKTATRIFSSDSMIYLGEKKRIILNLANGSGQYGEGFLLPDQTFNNGILRYHFGSNAGIKSHAAFKRYDFNNNEQYSSFFHLSGNISNPSRPKLIGDILKGYFTIGAISEDVNTVENALILPYAIAPTQIPKKIKDDYSKYMSKYIVDKYNEKTTSDKSIEFENDFDRGKHIDIGKLNETSFFTERITVKGRDISFFVHSNGFNNILDPDEEIIYLDSQISYIPYINIVKNGGVIIAKKDIYIDTIKNPLEKPLTIISLNGKILIGGEVNASLITLSPAGGLEGTFKRKKKITGNVICSNFNINSFESGLDIHYSPLYTDPHYNFKLIQKIRAVY